MKRSKMKVSEVVKIVACIVLAALFGLVIVIPVLVNLELKLEAIEYLKRH